MTRDEFAAVVDEVLDTPRTTPGRHDTIMRAADIYAGRRRVMMRDDTAEHQIRISLDSATQKLAVSCTCLATGRGTNGITEHYEPIEVRSRWEAAEGQAVWRAHVLEAEAASDGEEPC